VRFVRGQIYEAWVPFKDAPDNQKLRPVLVLGWSAVGATEDGVVLVAPITSFGDGGRARGGDVLIANWATAGLTKPSYVRARRLWGADPQMFHRQSAKGKVDEATMAAVLREVIALFS
jgi:mRNA-degrading endonuclease toxin of MazEF toxin-antitoxin module